MMQKLLQRWAGLAQRERIILAVGGVILGLSGVFVLLVDPQLEQLERLDRQISRTRQQQREVAALGAQFTALNSRLASVEAKLVAGQGQFALLPYLEEAAASAHVRERIAAMRPQATPPVQGYKETAVEIRLEGVQLPELLALLVKLDEAPTLLQVKRVQLKPRFDAPHMLEATILVSTHEREQ